MLTKLLLALLALTATASVLLFDVPSFGLGQPSAEAASFNEVKKLLASDAQSGDQFGINVAVSGDTAVVGAWQEDTAGDGRRRGICAPA